MKKILHNTFNNKTHNVKTDIYNYLKENYDENIKCECKLHSIPFEEAFIKTWLIETYERKENLNKYWYNIHLMYDDPEFY